MKFMKMTILFLITFLVGFGFVAKNKVEPELSFEETRELIKPVPTAPLEISAENEIIEENNDWKKEYESDFIAELLEIGEGFHGDQIKPQSREKWLGLFNQNGKSYLKYTNLKVSRVHDPVVDEENIKSGKADRVENGKSSILLLNNASFLKEGKVETLFGGNPNHDEIEENIDYLSLRVGFDKEFIIGDEKFSLSVKKGINKNREKIIALVLENKEIKQTLHSYESFDNDDNIGNLIWAGDLDEDNKPDFYFDLYINENNSYKCLFLSSKAETSRLLKKIAVFRTSGC